MAKKFFKRFLPDPKKILESEHLRILGTIIHNPNLWHLNRYSVSNAVTIGLIIAFIPIPFQMVVAAVLAIYFRANLPISVALVWITNPITTPPIFYFSYRLGSLLLNRPTYHFKFEFSFAWLLDEFNKIGVPFLLGSLVIGLFLGLLSNFLVRMFWRYMIVRDWHTRREKRKAQKQKKKKKRRQQKGKD